MAFILPFVAEAAADIGTAVTSTAATVGSTLGSITAPGAIATTAAPLDTALGSITAPGAIATTAAPWMAEAGLASTVTGGITGALGAYQTGLAQKGAARFNSEVAAQNQAQAKQNEALAGQAGAQQAGITSAKTRAELGAISANQGASGIDTQSGSAVDVRSSARELGELDALTVRSNAVREAYGYETQAANYGAEASVDTYEAQNAASAGGVSAASTFLGSAGSAANQFARYQLSSGGFDLT